MRPLTMAIVVALFATAPATARADGDPIAAEELFRAGSALWQSGKLSEACENFAKSQEAEPGVGTLFFLADCALRDGKRATAWYRLREAGMLAARKGDGGRQAQAEERARGLEKSLARLLVHSVEQPPPSGLIVRRDEASSTAAALDVAVPVDPGPHRIKAEAPGRISWSMDVTVADAAGTTVVDVPPLTSGPAVAAPAAPVAAAPPHATEPTPIAASTPPPRPAHVVPIAAGAVALVGVGVGTAFGLMARSSWSDVEQVCPNRTCPDAATQSAMSPKRDGAYARASVSTGAFLVAGTAAVVAVVAYLLEPSPRDAHTPASSSFPRPWGSIAF